MSGKKKALIVTCIVLISLFVISFYILTAYFVTQSTISSKRNQEYFDIYKSNAEEYIKADEEMLDKYGENMVVTFDSVITYQRSDDWTFFDTVRDTFFPIPFSTLEEFNDRMSMIGFEFKINYDDYKIVFEKNSAGELVVTSITEID